jgi:hypothetical protein
VDRDRELTLLKDRVEGLEAAIAQVSGRQAALADLVDRTIAFMKASHGPAAVAELEQAAETAFAP